MKLMALVTIQLAWAIFLVTYANTSEEYPNIEFPTLSTPDITFLDVSGGCGGFTDCIGWLAAIVFNIGAGVIFLVLFIIDLLVFLFELFGLLLDVSFTGIDGAPWQFNVLITILSSAVIAVLLFRAVRSGASTD